MKKESMDFPKRRSSLSEAGAANRALVTFLTAYYTKTIPIDEPYMPMLKRLWYFGIEFIDFISDPSKPPDIIEWV
jgi:hypothetical protein